VDRNLGQRRQKIHLEFGQRNLLEAESCEHGNEHAVSIRGGKVLD
jgi:hypothetical protein